MLIVIGLMCVCKFGTFLIGTVSFSLL